MSENPPDEGTMTPEETRRLTQAVMKRQVSLSLKVAAVFLVILFGLPLVNYFMPDLANRPMMGFSATWLFLAILFYPITWVLSWWFIQRSNKIEHDIANDIRSGHVNLPGSEPRS